MLPIVLDGSEDQLQRYRMAGGHLPSMRCDGCGAVVTVRRPPEAGTVRASLLRKLAMADHVRNACSHGDAQRRRQGRAS